MAAVFMLMITLGSVLVAAALMNWDWLYGERIAHFLSAQFGEIAARWYTGLAGAAIVALSVFYWIKN
jgi:hypothetical protein